MGCINKINAASLLPNCNQTPSGLAAPVDAYLYNRSDIASYSGGGTGSASVTRVAGTVGTNIYAANGGLTIDISIKEDEVTPQAWNVSFSFTPFTNIQTLTPVSGTKNEAIGFGNTELVLFVNHGNGVYRAYGLAVPFRLQEVESVLSYYRYTFGIDDYQNGTTIHKISADFYSKLGSLAT